MLCEFGKYTCISKFPPYSVKPYTKNYLANACETVLWENFNFIFFLSERSINMVAAD